ncbi:MAG: tetratricopeptide repeat protein, partial [Desulfobacteraceae bacterium]
SIENSEKALKIAPDFAVAHNNLGIAYLEKGDKERAKTHIHKAKELGYDVAPRIIQEIED